MILPFKEVIFRFHSSTWYIFFEKFVRSTSNCLNFLPEITSFTKTWKKFVSSTRKTRSSWTPKQPLKTGCLVISNHFLCKDWVHHPIDFQPLKNGWPWGSRQRWCGSSYLDLHILPGTCSTKKETSGDVPP